MQCISSHRSATNSRKRNSVAMFLRIRDQFLCAIFLAQQFQIFAARIRTLLGLKLEMARNFEQ